MAERGQPKSCNGLWQSIEYFGTSKEIHTGTMSTAWSTATTRKLGFPCLQPQNTLAEMIREDAEKAASQKLIDSEKCRTFMSRLINETLATTGPSIKGVEVDSAYGL